MQEINFIYRVTVIETTVGFLPEIMYARRQ